ncbi:hypothetical protein J6590_105169 [Homalodisca vitripennis]|nr:hypothetical protein J6590_105169 [Homalodisca vitripennis]
MIPRCIPPAGIVHSQERQASRVAKTGYGIHVRGWHLRLPWAEEQDVTSTWPLTGADVDPREVTSVSGRSNPQTPDPVRYPAPGDASCGYRAIRHRPVSIAGATIQRSNIVGTQKTCPPVTNIAIVHWSVRNKTQIGNPAGRYFSADDSEEFWRLAYAGLELQDQDRIVGIEPYFLPGSSADNLISFGEGRCLPGD